MFPHRVLRARERQEIASDLLGVRVHMGDIARATVTIALAAAAA